MITNASQITSLTIVYSIVYSGTDRRKYQSSSSLNRSPVNCPHKGPITRKKVSIWWRHHANLTHGGRMTHISFTELCRHWLCIGLSSFRRQAIAWTNDDLWSIGPLETTFKDSTRKCRLLKWRPSCPGLNVLDTATLNPCEVRRQCVHVLLVLPSLLLFIDFLVLACCRAKRSNTTIIDDWPYMEWQHSPWSRAKYHGVNSGELEQIYLQTIYDSSEVMDIQHDSWQLSAEREESRIRYLHTICMAEQA